MWSFSEKLLIINDDELDAKVQEITSLFPNIGEKTVSGRLKHLGIVIQRDRVRESLRRVDPSGVNVEVFCIVESTAYRPQMLYGM